MAGSHPLKAVAARSGSDLFPELGEIPDALNGEGVAVVAIRSGPGDAASDAEGAAVSPSWGAGRVLWRAENPAAKRATVGQT